MSVTFPLRECTVVVALLILPGSILAESPVLEFRLNSPGGAETSSGSESTQIEMIADVAFHSADGEGPSGKPGDTAFDNRDASQMGGTVPQPGNGLGLAVPMGDLPATFESFTVQGWYKVADEMPGNYARLFDSPRVGLFFSPEGLRLSIITSAAGGSSAQCASDLYLKNDDWVFYAVTYDSMAGAENVSFYFGSIDEPVRRVATSTIEESPIFNSSEGRIVLGNVEDGSRPFKGLLDNLRFWVVDHGDEGALSLGELEAVRQQDVKFSQP